MAKAEYIRIMTVKEREKLYHEVWQEPMIKVAERYGVSNVELRNRCIKAEIPFPPRGYWQRKSGREGIPIPPLKPISEANRKYISNFKVEYELSNRRINGKQMEVLTQDSRDDIRKYCIELLNIKDEEKFHIELKNHINYIEALDKAVCDLIPDDLIGNYLTKLMFIGEQSRVTGTVFKLLPIKVSKENRKRAYKIMNAFLNIIEDYEGELTLDNEFMTSTIANDFVQYSVGREIYIEILGIQLEFMIEEIKETTATTPPKLSFWLKVISGKEIDKRMESEYKRNWYCIEDNEEHTVEEGLADFIMVLLTYLHLFKGKRGSCLKTKGMVKNY